VPLTKDNMSFQTILTAALVITSFLGFSQTVSIQGKVTDAKTGETIPGVKIMVEGQGKGAYTDFDGNYKVLDLADGAYTLTFKYDTYRIDTVKNIQVNAQSPAIVNVKLSMAVQEITEMNVSKTVQRDNNAGTVQMQIKSAQVMDGISSETIKRGTDSKASDVLKRVSGASVQDNKFVVIRGLSDRYNFALINGASLPSSESDRKAFSFDIFPSNMLDNLYIIKSATPDLPGEFAGGVIEINTTEPKETNFQSIQVSGAFNTLATFRNFHTSGSSPVDFLGFGAGFRAIPEGIPSTDAFALLNKDEKANLAQQMNFSWGSDKRKALPNGSLQYTIGRTIKMKESSLGLVFAYSYQNNFNTNKTIRREFEEQATEVVKKMELTDSVFTQTILNAAMFNMTYKLSDKHKISFKNMYSVNSDDRVNIRRGVRELDNDPRQWERSTNIWYTQNNLLSSQLIGDHKVGKGKLVWNLGFSDVRRNIPNLRRVVYRKYSLEETDPIEQYVAVIQANGTIPTAAGNMFWSKSNEKIISARYDYSLPVAIDSNKIEFKVGAMHQYRTRDFEARNFGFSQYKPTGSSFQSELLLLPENEIFSSENFGVLDNGQGGFKLEEASSVDDSYQASSFLNAGYLMADAKIGKFVRIIGGARLESYNQKFNYIEFGSNLEKRIDTTVIDILPSLNLVFPITKRMNIRASYYKTVSRPEFRELAPFAFYNFLMDNILSGNPELKRAVIHNFDLRYEYAPGKGQIFSVSGFYKDFTDPIELINRTGTSGAPELYFTNVSKVVNLGAELEYRLNLGFLKETEDTTFWDNSTLYTNFSYIRSKVDLAGVIGSGTDRPLQGQSPYLINAGFSYFDEKSGWAFNASYNVVGQRIYIVGNVQEPSVWENGRNIVDVQVSKLINEKFEVKLNVKDLLAQDLVFFQDLNGNKKLDNGIDNPWQEINYGQTVTLSFKYLF
jgi:outer membrane receptor protein involved in Fe transport